MSSTLRFSMIAALLTSALALGLIIVHYTRPAPIPVVADVPPPLTASFLAAARTLPAGTLARDEDFVVKTMPVVQIPKGVIQDTPEARASLRGSLIRTFMEAGVPVTQDDILRPRDRGFIASVLKEGYRAVAVGVDAVSGVAGLVWPGDHVDLILVQEMGDKEPAAQRALSETVLSDIRVIAVDQEMVQGASDNNATAGKLVKTVTLEVTPAQAQVIAVAATMGKLSLSIRSAVGTSPYDHLTPTFSSDVSSAIRQPTDKTVTVFNGTQSKEVTFK